MNEKYKHFSPIGLEVETLHTMKVRTRDYRYGKLIVTNQNQVFDCARWYNTT